MGHQVKWRQYRNMVLGPGRGIPVVSMGCVVARGLQNVSARATSFPWFRGADWGPQSAEALEHSRHMVAVYLPMFLLFFAVPVVFSGIPPVFLRFPAWSSH